MKISNDDIMNFYKRISSQFDNRVREENFRRTILKTFEK